MRLFFAHCLTLLTCLILVGCTGFPTRFSDREIPRDTGRERLISDINARMSQGDIEGARRLMDRLDPQAQTTERERSRQQGIEVAAQVEQTSYQNGQQNRTLPDRSNSQTQGQTGRPRPRSARDIIIDQLLSMSPPDSREYQRQFYQQLPMSRLQTTLATMYQARDSGQTYETFPQINPQPAAVQPASESTSSPPPLPADLETAAQPRAPEPGAGMTIGGIPGMAFPTLSGTGPDSRSVPGQTGPAIQPAGGNLMPGGVIPASGSTNPVLAPGSRLPVIDGRDQNPFPSPPVQPSDNLAPQINQGQSGLRNPNSIPGADGPATIIPQLEQMNETQRTGPGRAPVDETGSLTMPLPPYPEAEETSQPGMFSQNLAVIQRAGETIKARVWGQEESPVNATPLPPVPPLLAAIESLEKELLAATPEEVALDELDFQRKAVALRALYLARNEYSKAIEPIQKINAEDREFWQQVFWAMSNHFNTDGISDPNARAAETIEQLRSAVAQLHKKADLKLRNVTFCHSIVSFGNYERFNQDLFTTGQPVLLYAEIENFNSQKQVDPESQVVQHHTALSSTITIYRHGRQNAMPVATIPFDVTKDVCRNVRRDYFHSYEFTIPEDLEPGKYTLVLSVSDKLSSKYATRRVHFEVE